MNTATVVVLVVAWLSAGLLSGLWMARRGYDPLWILVALPLGLLFVPIAVERVSGRPAGVTIRAGGDPPAESNAGAGPRVLVGLDGSAESEEALTTILRLFGPCCALLMLAEVLHIEATEDSTRADIKAASRRLSQAAARVDCGCAVQTDVLAGAPGPALRQFAEQQDIDILVVGRRGRGLSRLVLGSVSADLVEHSPIPVLVVEPVTARRPSTASAQTAT